MSPLIPFEPKDKEVRQLKADILRQLAYRTNGTIARAFLMTEALTLEGKITYPKLVPPSAEVIAESPENFVDYFRVRIDPKKSENTDKVIQFVFAEKAVSLHVRRGIVEYIPVPSDYHKKADYILMLDSKTWAQLYLSSATLEDLISSAKVKVEGDSKELAVIFDMFDKFIPTKNYVVPPLED